MNFIVTFSVEVSDGFLVTSLPAELINTTELKLKNIYLWQPLQTYVTISKHFTVKANGIRFRGTVNDCNNILKQLFYHVSELLVLGSWKYCAPSSSKCYWKMKQKFIQFSFLFDQISILASTNTPFWNGQCLLHNMCASTHCPKWTKLWLKVMSSVHFGSVWIHTCLTGFFLTEIPISIKTTTTTIIITHSKRVYFNFNPLDQWCGCCLFPSLVKVLEITKHNLHEELAYFQTITMK